METKTQLLDETLSSFVNSGFLEANYPGFYHVYVNQGDKLDIEIKAIGKEGYDDMGSVKEIVAKYKTK